MQPPPKKLLDRLRDAIQVRHYSYRTEQTYVMGVPEVEIFGSFSSCKTL